MEIHSFINQFERSLRIQRYSDATIRNYKSALESFLKLADKKFSSINEIDSSVVEKYIYWMIEKHGICQVILSFTSLRFEFKYSPVRSHNE